MAHDLDPLVAQLREHRQGGLVGGRVVDHDRFRRLLRIETRHRLAGQRPVVEAGDDHRDAGRARGGTGGGTHQVSPLARRLLAWRPPRAAARRPAAASGPRSAGGDTAAGDREPERRSPARMPAANGGHRRARTTSGRWALALTVATNVIDGTITSSPERGCSRSSAGSTDEAVAVCRVRSTGTDATSLTSESDLTVRESE